MRLSILFHLLDKQLVAKDGKRYDIYGLSELHVCPTRIGLGRAALDLAIRMADEDGKTAVVGFAEEELTEFYGKCGWFLGNWYLCVDDGLRKCLISSKPVPYNIVIDVNRMW